jgi:hypothetical protein
MDVYEQSEIRNLTMTELRQEWEALSSDLDEPPPDPSAHLERIASERFGLQDALEREQAIAQQTTHDLHEMGLLARRRQRGEVSRLKNRIADASDFETKTLAEIDLLNEEEVRCVDATAQRERWLVENAPTVRRRYALERELWWREHQSALAAEVAMPTYLSDVVGHRPDKPSERAAWHQAVRAIEVYRSRWNITDESAALGNTHGDDRHATERADLVTRLARNQEPMHSDDEVIERSMER